MPIRSNKPSRKAFLFISLLSFSLAAYAQSVVNTVDGNGNPSFGLRKNRRTAAAHPKASPTPVPGALRGVCSVVPTDAMTIPGPCVNIMLVLNDDTGKEVERTRTNTQGVFEFSVDVSKAYRIASGSRLYDIVSPQGEVHGGSTIALKIREK